MTNKTQYTRPALAGALAAAVLLLAAGPAHAVVFDLKTGSKTLTMPDGAPVQMWGFGLQSDPDVSIPGPQLTVPVGDTTITINLVNNLPVPVSIVIPALPAPLTPQWNSGAPGPRTSLQQRVVSFTATAAANGGTASYTWSNVAPGTYLYHSGTRPAAQVQMGLYGAVKHDAAAGSAYPGVAYDKEVVLLYSEIDPVAHAAIVAGTYGSAVEYRARYFLINGQPASDPPAIAAGNVNERILLRLLNAGLKTVVPALDGGAYVSLVAEDGQQYPYAKQRYSTLLPAGKTVDAVLTPTSAGSLALLDRSLRATNGANGGPLVVKLAVGTADGAPVAVADSYTLAEDGSLDTVAAGQPSVLANDTGATTAVLATSAQAGTLTLNADGSFVYAPKGNFTGTDFFTYRAAAGTQLSNLVTVELKVSAVNDPPMAMADSYQTPPGIALELMAPGVLANDHDPDGDALTAELVSGPSGGSLSLLASGQLTYIPAAGTTSDSFTYRVFDGVAYSAAATVSIAVVATNLPPVAQDDFATTTLNNAAIISVLANDSDPDGAVNPATIVIVGAPSMGGGIGVNANGTVSYTPKPGFLGSESFSYTIKDSQGLVSSPATVLVNVVKP